MQVYDVVMSGYEQNSHSALRELGFRGNFSAMDVSLSGMLKNPFKSRAKKQHSLKVLR